MELTSVMKISPLAGKPADWANLVDVPRLVTAYYTQTPDPSVPEQRVAFGTSGHRGCAFKNAFNEGHILAICQAISWIEAKANELLESGLRGLKRMPYERALRASSTHRHGFREAHVADLGAVIDMDAIRASRGGQGPRPLKAG